MRKFFFNFQAYFLKELYIHKPEPNILRSPCQIPSTVSKEHVKGRQGAHDLNFIRVYSGVGDQGRRIALKIRSHFKLGVCTGSQATCNKSLSQRIFTVISRNLCIFHGKGVRHMIGLRKYASSYIPQFHIPTFPKKILKLNPPAIFQFQKFENYRNANVHKIRQLNQLTMVLVLWHIPSCENSKNFQKSRKIVKKSKSSETKSS